MVDQCQVEKRTEGVEPSFFPAIRFAIRSHAAKRIEVNLNPRVAIWNLANKRPRHAFHYTYIIVTCKHYIDIIIDYFKNCRKSLRSKDLGSRGSPRRPNPLRGKDLGKFNYSRSHVEPIIAHNTTMIKNNVTTHPLSRIFARMQTWFYLLLVL